MYYISTSKIPRPLAYEDSSGLMNSKPYDFMRTRKS